MAEPHTHGGTDAPECTTCGPTVEQALAALRGQTYTAGPESTLEDDVMTALAKWHPRRQVRIAPGSTIDVVVGRIGIECKVDGTWSGVARQVQRYAAARPFDAIIVVTTRIGHLDLPKSLHGTPVHVVHTGGLI